MNLQLQPVGTKSLASHLCRKYRLLRIAYPTRIGQQLDVRMEHMLQHIVLLILQFDAFHGHCHHLRARSQNRLFHHLVGIEFSRSQKKTRVELTPRNN